MVVRRNCESGLALLPVISAMATLSLLVILLLTSAAAAHETAAFVYDRAQSRTLARAVLAQVEQAALDGVLPLPSGTSSVEILNGDVVAGAPPRALDVARFPRLAVPGWPPRTGAPAWARGAEPGVGGRVELRPVLDTDGDPRVIAGASLIEATAEAWYRRGRAETSGRFMVGGGTVIRLE